MNIKIPEKVNNIIQTLNAHGYEAYVVGGCVRDSILGRIPGDWDITTSAKPEAIKELFPRTIDTGIQHGTITVMMGKEGFEVTTYRIDGEYADGRHPNSVEFTSNLVEDLKRRDFTINALAFNYEKGMVDEFDGISDMENKIIRCVGNPIDRFTEDALRMMRAVRFSAQLSFEIEEKTFEAIRALSHNISKVSKERIQVELTKTLNSEHPEYVEYYYTSGLSSYIFPIIDQHINGGNWNRIATILRTVPAQTDLRYSILFMDGEDSVAEAAMKGLRFDNKTVETVTKIVRYVKLQLKPEMVDIRTKLRIMGEELFRKLVVCKCAYAKVMSEDTKVYEDIVAILDNIIANGDPCHINELAINGKDLIAMGVQPGKGLGEILEKLLDRVIEEPKLNSVDTLKELVDKMK